MTDGAIQILVTAGGTFAFALMQLFREWRNRKWLLEDLARREAKLLGSIEQNTAVSVRAFAKAEEGLHAANNTNEKIMKVHERMERHRKAQREQEEEFRKALAELDAMLPEKPERSG